jgi:hypothetical protein
MYFISSVLLESLEQAFYLIYAGEYYREIRINDAAERLLSK